MLKLPLTEKDKHAGLKDFARKFKLIELWAQDDTPRKGWLKVCSRRNE